MRTFTITKKQAEELKEGLIVRVNNKKIALHDCKVVLCNTKFPPFTRVIPAYRSTKDTLNLTTAETLQAMTDLVTYVYRSSGAKNATGKVMSREQQIKENKARVIKIVLTPIVDIKKGDELNPMNYRWECVEDTTFGEEVRVLVINSVEEF